MKDTENLALENTLLYPLTESIQTYRERKEKWVEYLKSKNYSQTRGRLRSFQIGGVYSYCCLGVACELHRELTGKGYWGDEGEGDDVEYYVRREPGLSAIVAETELPVPAAEWLGLRTETANIAPKDRFTPGVSLIDLNDDLGWDFDKIADFIDSEPPGLFKWNLEGGVNGETDHPLWKEATLAKKPEMGE